MTYYIYGQKGRCAVDDTAHILELHATDPAAARIEALALLAREEKYVFRPESDDAAADADFVALKAAGILTIDDFAAHNFDVAERRFEDRSK